jgi:hypothetical protein
MSKTQLNMKEYDEAGNLVATYIQSISRRADGDATRVDVVVSVLLTILVAVLLTRSVTAPGKWKNDVEQVFGRVLTRWVSTERHG